MSGKRKKSKYVQEMRYSQSKAMREHNKVIKDITKEYENLSSEINQLQEDMNRELLELSNEYGFGKKDEIYSTMLKEAKDKLSKHRKSSEPIYNDIEVEYLENLIVNLEGVMDMDKVFNTAEMEFDLSYAEAKVQGREKLGAHPDKFVDPANMEVRLQGSPLEDEYKKQIPKFMHVFYTFANTADLEKYFYFIYQVIFNILFDIRKGDTSISKSYRDMVLNGVRKVIDAYPGDTPDLPSDYPTEDDLKADQDVGGPEQEILDEEDIDVAEILGMLEDEEDITQSDDISNEVVEEYTETEPRVESIDTDIREEDTDVDSNDEESETEEENKPKKPNRKSRKKKQEPVEESTNEESSDNVEAEENKEGVDNGDQDTISPGKE